MHTTLIERFNNREVKGKDAFEVRYIEKSVARDVIAKYHYLGKKDFMFTYAFGLFVKNTDDILGCATFGMVGGVGSLKGWFGLDNSHSNEFLELTRLVMLPCANGGNLTSFLLGNSLKIIRKQYKHVRAVVTLADNSMHVGAIYQACNFKYFGLSNKKTDFYCSDGKLNPRGATKDKHGVWLPRTQKHRYCYIIDNTLDVKYERVPYPKGNHMNETPTCCEGTHIVHDNRYDEYFTCPICTGELTQISEDEARFWGATLEV